MNPLFIAIIFLVWIYILRVLKKAELYSWRFIWGSMGLFIILMLIFLPVLTEPLSRCVLALAGLIGDATDAFRSYFKYGIIFIESANQALTLKIDLECSGLIEIMAFVSLLCFFDVYSFNEKIMIGIFGFIYIIVCNALRIAMICLSVHYLGTSVFYVFHTFVGRIFFYVFTIILYFYVFTKPQVIKMKVGNFKYEHHQTNH